VGLARGGVPLVGGSSFWLVFGTAAVWSRRDWWRSGRRAAVRVSVVGAGVALALLGGTCSAAFAQTTITVTSTLDTLDTKMSGECTLSDAMVVADEDSNPVLTTSVEQPSGNDALTPRLLERCER